MTAQEGPRQGQEMRAQHNSGRRRRAEDEGGRRRSAPKGGDEGSGRWNITVDDGRGRWETTAEGSVDDGGRGRRRAQDEGP